MVVIKINELPNTEAEIQARGERAWKITEKKIERETNAIVLYKGLILNEYKILNHFQDEQEPDRMAFEFELIENSNLKGLRVDYPTSAPCTTTDIIKVKLY